MTNLPHELDPSLTALEIFNDAYGAADNLVDRLEALRTAGNRENTSEINIPRTNLVLSWPSHYQDRTKREFLTGHVAISEGIYPVRLLSLTTVSLSPEDDPIPLSVGSYRDNEPHPDFFMKRDPISGLIVCKLANVGLKGQAGTADNIGDSSFEPSTSIGDISEEHLNRTSMVCEAIKGRVASIQEVEQVLEDRVVKKVQYKPDGINVTRYYPVH